MFDDVTTDGVDEEDLENGLFEQDGESAEEEEEGGVVVEEELL